MNITLEEEEHSIDTLRAKYRAMISVQILDVVIRCIIGGLWILIVYCVILGSIKLFTLVYNQYFYNYYKNKWEKEVMQFEDEQCIEQTNQKYKKIIIQYYDRLDRYDPKMKSGLYRYTFLIIIVIVMTTGWMFIDYTRSCIGYGVVILIIYSIYSYLNNNYIQPYLQYREQEKEKKRLDAAIAEQKKRN